MQYFHLLNVIFSIFRALLLHLITCMSRENYDHKSRNYLIINQRVEALKVTKLFYGCNCNIITEILLVTLLVTAKSNIITVTKLQ